MSQSLLSSIGAWVLAASATALAADLTRIDSVARASDMESERTALANLQRFRPVVTFDETKPDRPAIGIRFHANSEQKLTDDDLVNLKKVPHLRALDMGSQHISDAGLESLKGLTELEGLDLRWNKVTAPGVVRLIKGLRKLQRLGLSGVPIRDNDLLDFKLLTDLRDLSLRATLITDKGLEHLKAFAKLRRLSLMKTNITDAGLACLKALTNLEDLDLDKTPITDAGLKQLQSLSNLKQLQLHGTKVSDEGVRNLKGALPQLQVSPDGHAKPVKEQVRGGIIFPAEKRMWLRITGKVKVLNAYVLAFEDGTEVSLSGAIDAPELAQKGVIGGAFYPCGKEAADFLKDLIGDRPVTFLGDRQERNGKRLSGSCFVGETCLEIEMVRNGWALSHHSGMDAWEIIAREKKRGFWRGQFVVPERWRKGERLPGE